jgi:hypothetical protein
MSYELQKAFAIESYKVIDLHEFAKMCRYTDQTLRDVDNKFRNIREDFANDAKYASEWFGSVWFLPPWNQTDAGLVFCRIGSGSVRSGLGFYWFGTCKKSTYKDVEMHS